MGCVTSSRALVNGLGWAALDRRSRTGGVAGSPQPNRRAPKDGAVGSAPNPIPSSRTCGTSRIQSPASRPAQTRAVVCRDRTEEASMPGLPNTAMSVTGNCGAASPHTTDP